MHHFQQGAHSKGVHARVELGREHVHLEPRLLARRCCLVPESCLERVYGRVVESVARFDLGDTHADEAF